MRWKILLSVIVLAGILVALGFFWPFPQHSDTLRLPGIVEIQEVRLGSKIGGRVGRVLVAEGDLIQPNQELVVFDIPELEAQLEQRQAQMHQAEADLDKAKNGPRPEEIREAQSEVASNDAELNLARSELERASRMYRDQSSSRAEYDTALATRNRLEAQLKVSQARLDLLKAGTRSEDLVAAEARVAEARGKVNEIQSNLQEAVVRAPEEAVLDVLGVRKGDLVLPNQVILRVLRINDLWVKIYVPETQLGKVRLNQKAEVTIDSYPGERFQGTVFFIAAESEFTPRNVQSPDERRFQVFGAKVRVPQPEDPGKRILKSGMAAEVSLPLQEAP